MSGDEDTMGIGRRTSSRPTPAARMAARVAALMSVLAIGAIAWLAAAGTLEAVARAASQGSTPLPPPVLGRSVDLSPVKGSVSFTAPGKSSEPLPAPRQVPVGTVVDAISGTVRVTAADSGTNPPYSGDFSRGEFKIEQSATGGGVTQIIIEGSCTKSRPAIERPLSPGRKPKARIRRFLQITANGYFTIVGSNTKTAENGAASWTVNDNCDGATSVSVRSGQVKTSSSRRIHQILAQDIGPGESDVTRCYPAKGTLQYCEDVYDDPADNSGVFELLTRHATSYGVWLRRPGHPTKHCKKGRFKRHQRVDTVIVGCTLDSLEKGNYGVEFLVDGKQLGILLPFKTDHARDPFGTTDTCTASTPS